MNRRVAITGVGVVSPLGLDYASFWDALSRGEPAIREMTIVPPSTMRYPNAAEVRGFDPVAHFEEKELNFVDRFAQFAMVAAREARAASGIQFDPERTAIITGTSAGGQTTEDENFYSYYAMKGRVSPLTIPRVMGNAAASRISLEFGITGPVFTISTACSSSNHAIGQAFWMVRSGIVDAAITGGSEAPFSTGFLKSWEAMRVVSPDTCRPFSRDRKGLILGEGGAVLILEPLEAAHARGATVWAEIVGFGMSSDAHHITQPSVAGPVRAMRAALADARITPEQVGYINAHGTGTIANDSSEATAIREAFAGAPPVSSTKSMHGHALGAAGALEAAATIGALRHGVLPPTANFTSADPACDLDVVPNMARVVQVEYALSNSFAFGGLNAVLAFHNAD